MFQKNYTKKVVPLIKGHFHGSLSHYRYREAIRRGICWKTSCLSTMTKNGNDIAVDPEKFFNANFAKKNVFHEKYLKLFV